MSVYKVQAEISLQDRASVPFTQMTQKMQSSAQKMSSRVTGAFTRMRARIGRVFSRLTSGIRALLPLLTIGGLAYGFISAAREGASFTDQMAKVSTMLHGPAETYMKSFSSSIRSMSVEFGRSTKDLTDGLYNILSAGIPAAKAVDHLRIAVKSAVGGFTGLMDVTRAVSAIMTAYQSENVNAARATNILAAVVVKGITTLGELAPAIGMVTSVADSAGVKLNDLAGMLATVTKSGVGTFKSVTSLRALLMSLQKPTEQNVVIIEKLQSVLKEKGAIAFARELQKMVDAGTKITEVFGEARAQLAVNMLSKNVDFLKESIDKAANSAGLAGQMFEKMTKTPAFRLRQLGQELVRVRREIGEAMMPALLAAGTELRNLLRTPWIMEGLKDIASSLIGVAAGILKISVRIAAGITRLQKYWKELRKRLVDDLPSWLNTALTATETFVKNWQILIGEGLAGKIFWDNIYNSIRKGLIRITGAFETWSRAMQGFFKGGIDEFMREFQNGVDDLNRGITAIEESARRLRKLRTTERGRAAGEDGGRPPTGFPSTTAPPPLSPSELARIMRAAPEEMAMGIIPGAQMLGPFGIPYGGRAAHYIQRYGRKRGMALLAKKMAREQRIAPQMGFFRDVTPAQRKMQAFMRRPVAYAERITETIGGLAGNLAEAIEAGKGKRAAAISQRISQLQRQRGMVAPEIMNQLAAAEATRDLLKKNNQIIPQKLDEQIAKMKEALGEKAETPLDELKKAIEDQTTKITNAVAENYASAYASVSVNCAGASVEKQEITTPGQIYTPVVNEEPTGGQVYSA